MERIRRFATAFPGHPDVAREQYVGDVLMARLSQKACIVPGLDMLSDLDVIFCGGHSKAARVSGISLVPADGPRNPQRRGRYLYLFSQEFCERLAALTDSRIHEIVSNWYGLLFRHVSSNQLPKYPEQRSKYRKQTLCTLVELARVAIRDGQRLMLYVELRRER